MIKSLVSTISTVPGLGLDSWDLPEVTRLPTRVKLVVAQSSFGHLAKLPNEILRTVFGHLTCDDIEALLCCSTGGVRRAVLACPNYRTLLQHAPAILNILKRTQLARNFTITQIFKTFTRPSCMTCSQFGGYVFLLSFTRCCMQCAETRLEFLPISRNEAKILFGMEGKGSFDSLPQLETILGVFRSSRSNTVEYCSERQSLYSRAMVERLHNHKKLMQSTPGEKSLKALQRYMALAPLPCFSPKSASIDGCDEQTHGRTFLKPNQLCSQCHFIIQHDSRHIFNHFQDGGVAETYFDFIRRDNY